MFNLTMFTLSFMQDQADAANMTRPQSLGILAKSTVTQPIGSGRQTARQPIVAAVVAVALLSLLALLGILVYTKLKCGQGSAKQALGQGKVSPST